MFLNALIENPSNGLTELEKKALTALVYKVCFDIDGAFGNNIWNLEYGSFKFFEEEDIKLSFEKKHSEVKDKNFEEGRATFAYQSKDGDFIIRQNNRNKKIFLVYVSDTISKRLLNALRMAEENALGIIDSYGLTNETTNKIK